MKIRKIKLKNHPILGNLELNFTDKENKPVNTVLIVGENGTGKSSILRLLFEFSNLTIHQSSKEIRQFEVELNEEEMKSLRHAYQLKFEEDIHRDRIYTFRLDFNAIKTWANIEVIGRKKNGDELVMLASSIGNDALLRVLRSIYSDTEINFLPKAIRTVTATNIDTLNVKSQKSNSTTATEIAQLLVDIQNLDALDFTEWAKRNSDKQVDSSKMDVRTRRFSSAFNSLFPDKKLKRIETRNGTKQVIFEEHGKEMTIDNLSSGEKQIVFRGSFLLKDRGSMHGSLVLIDEPEISLHPIWQQSILNFFKGLFTDWDGTQSSQLIVATHSPFIIHNFSRNDDKVIVLKKDNAGAIKVVDNASFYTWGPEEVIHEAFNLNLSKSNPKTLIFVGGETDEKYLKACIECFNIQDESFEIRWIGREIEKGRPENTGDTALSKLRAFLLAHPDQITHKIALIFDCDAKAREESIDHKLIVRTLIYNHQNTRYSKGIENLLILLPEIDFDSFYETRIDRAYGGKVQTLDKMRLCNFICRELALEKRKEVLEMMNNELNRILGAIRG